MSQAGSLGNNGGSGPSTDLHVARYIVSAGGNADGANFLTITSAYAAAVAAGAPQTVFIQPGTYTEDITLQSGINLAAFDCDALSLNVTIQGKLSGSFAGTSSLSGICLLTNGDYCLEVTGGAATLVELKDCFVYATNSPAIHFTNSNGGSKIELRDCKGDIGNAGIGYFTHTGSGALKFFGGAFENNAADTTQSTCSGSGDLNFYNVFFFVPFTTSGSGALTGISCQFFSPMVIGASGVNSVFNCYCNGGVDSAISISSHLVLANCAVDSINANAITGAGELKYGLLTFVNTSSTVNTVTLTPLATLI